MARRPAREGAGGSALQPPEQGLRAVRAAGPLPRALPRDVPRARLLGVELPLRRAREARVRRSLRLLCVPERGRRAVERHDPRGRCGDTLAMAGRAVARHGDLRRSGADDSGKRSVLAAGQVLRRGRLSGPEVPSLPRARVADRGAAVGGSSASAPRGAAAGGLPGVLRYGRRAHGGRAARVPDGAGKDAPPAAPLGVQGDLFGRVA